MGTRTYSSSCADGFGAINHPEMALCSHNDVSWIPDKKSRAHQRMTLWNKNKTVSLKKSPASAPGFSVCFSLEKRELAQPKGFGWLKPLEDVMMCKASFTHTYISISCTECAKPQPISGILISHGKQHRKISAAPQNGKISRKGQQQVGHYEFHSALQPICGTACLFLSSHH